MASGREGAYLLYDVLLYASGLFALPWVGLRCLVSLRYRSDLSARLGRGPVLEGAAPRVLLHGVSVGEVSAMRPLVGELRARRPDLHLVVSSSTPGGRQTARRLFPDLDVVAFPIDFRGACRRFLARVRPAAVVLMELEIWPNFLRGCSARQVPVAIVNGRITERSLSGYLRFQSLLPQFDRIALYGVQNELYAKRFERLEVPPERIVRTGNLKFDVLPDSDDDAAWRASPWPAWTGGRPALALGSTHAPEELELLTAAAGRPEFADVLFLVVPRHPERAPRLLRELRAALPGRPVQLRSAATEGAPLPAGAVLLVDGFGELEAAYRSVQVAFLGGSLIRHGGQNMLEAAALGVPVLVGPHTENFQEEVELLEAAGALRSASEAGVLLEFAADWLADPAAAGSAGRAGREALAGRRGAAASTYAALSHAGFLPSPISTPGPVGPP